MGDAKKRVFRWLGIAGLVILGLVLAGAVGGAFWINSLVRGKRFADYAAKLVERETGCQGSFEPFSFAGLGVATKGYQGKGTPTSRFASIQARGIRIEVDPFALLRLSLEVRRVSIVRLKLMLQKVWSEKLPMPASLSIPEAKGESPALPGKFRISMLSIGWPVEMAGGGMADGIDLRGETTEEGLGLRARGGRVRAAGMPELLLAEAHGLLVGRTLRLEAVEMHPKGAPEALLAGTGKLGLSPSEPTDLSWQVRALPAGTVLPSPWKERVSGEIRGFGKVVAAERERYETEGDLFLDQGSLHGIPFLVALDALLRVRTLQDLPLSRAQCHVEGKGDRIRISKIDLQSGETMVMNGWTEVEGGRVSGVLNVGLRSDLARLIPNVNVGLFELGAGGYFWTTVRLSGTTDHVQEDLTPRLDRALKSSLPMQIERKGQQLLRRVVPGVP